MLHPVRQSATRRRGSANMGSTNDDSTLHEMIWPETGLHTISSVPKRPKDELNEEDTIELTIDFVTLSLSPLEFIQLASFLRMSIDDLLGQHPKFQRAVINAFDIKD
jgi:hypothetical protein